MEQMNPTLERLEDQAGWYSKKSGWNQMCFKRLKVLEIIAAALIPFFAGINVSSIVTGGLGVVIVVLESLQGVYQFQSNWISYRSTAEALKHEKYLWQAKAGPYLKSENPDALFADRVESLLSTENSKWITTTEQVGKTKQQLG